MPEESETVAERHVIDLSRETVYLLTSHGPQPDVGYNLQKHVEFKASEKQDYVGKYNPDLPAFALPYVGCNGPDYQGKKCHGDADGCLDRFDCTVLMTYEGYSFESYIIELQLNLDDDPTVDARQYIGSGLSQDSVIGNDSFVICGADQVRSYITLLSETTGEILPQLLDQPGYGISNAIIREEEGYLYCSYVRQANMSVSAPPASPDADPAEVFDFFMNVNPYATIVGTGTVDPVEGLPVDFTESFTTDPIDYTLSNRLLDPRYTDCFTDVGCIGMPLDCEDERLCDVLLTFKQLEWSQGTTEFSLSGPIGEGGYMALGLSTDTIMGSDLVFVCSTYNVGDSEIEDLPLPSPLRDVYLYRSWNPSDEQFNYPSLGQLEEGILDSSLRLVDNMATCNFTLNSTIGVKRSGGEEAKFDLTNSYHVLLASGSMTEVYSTSLHSQKMSTGAMVDFKDLGQRATGVSPALVKAHAACMIVAWFFAGSSGIFIAMYMKKQFGDFKILGKDAWFPLHRLLMVLTWLTGIAGFVAIVVQYEFRPLQKERIKNNPHSLLGLISILLMFIQPFMAVLRCGAQHKLRPVFNVIHFATGFVAMALSMGAVYLTTLESFPSALLKKEVEYIAISYMGFFGVWHLCMMAYSAVKWNTREANDIIISAFAALFFIGNLSMTITLLVYVLDSEFLVSKLIEGISV